MVSFSGSPPEQAFQGSTRVLPLVSMPVGESGHEALTFRGLHWGPALRTAAHAPRGFSAVPGTVVLLVTTGEGWVLLALCE